jgi:hypothetical protein
VRPIAREIDSTHARVWSKVQPAAIGTHTWMPRLPVSFGCPTTPRCSRAVRYSPASRSSSSHDVFGPGSTSMRAHVGSEGSRTVEVHGFSSMAP